MGKKKPIAPQKSGSKFLMAVTTKSLPWKYGLGKSLPQSLKLLNWQKKNSKSFGHRDPKHTHQELQKRTPKKRLKQFVLFEAWTFHKPCALNAHKLSTPGRCLKFFEAMISNTLGFRMLSGNRWMTNKIPGSLTIMKTIRKPPFFVGQNELPHRWRWWRLRGFAISIEFTAWREFIIPAMAKHKYPAPSFRGAKGRP